MNLEVMGDYLPLFEKALWLTLWIGWLGILLAFLQGLRDGERLVTVKDMALQAQSGKIDGTLWLNIYAVSDK